MLAFLKIYLPCIVFDDCLLLSLITAIVKCAIIRNCGGTSIKKLNLPISYEFSSLRNNTTGSADSP